MALLQRIRQDLAGAACEIDWDDDDAITYAAATWLWRVPVPCRPHPGGGLRPTHLPQLGRVERSRTELMWPHTAAGNLLRCLYVDAGERALCDMPSAPEWWSEEYHDRWS